MSSGLGSAFASVHKHTHHKGGLVRRGLEDAREAAEQRSAVHKPEGERHQHPTLARPARTGTGTGTDILLLQYLTRTLSLSLSVSVSLTA